MFGVLKKYQDDGWMDGYLFCRFAFRFSSYKSSSSCPFKFLTKISYNNKMTRKAEPARSAPTAACGPEGEVAL